MVLMFAAVVGGYNCTFVYHFRAQGAQRRLGDVVQALERGFAHGQHLAVFSDPELKQLGRRPNRARTRLFLFVYGHHAEQVQLFNRLALFRQTLFQSRPEIVVEIRQAKLDATIRVAHDEPDVRE